MPTLPPCVSASPALCSPCAITHVVFFSEGTKKLTNKATLWYVPLSLKNVDKVLEVPPVVVRRPPSASLGGQMAEGSQASQESNRRGRGPGRPVEWDVPVWDLRAGLVHAGDVLVDTPPGGPFLMSLTRGKAGVRMVSGDRSFCESQDLPAAWPRPAAPHPSP